MAEISIILPVYNKKRYIQKLFEMIADQTFRNYECIVIDDGSTDGSSDICDEIARQDKRFLVFHIPNSGVSNARNLGLEKAKGAFITFIDADDELDSTYLQNLYDRIKESNAEMVIGAYSRICDESSWSEIMRYDMDSGLYSIRELLPRFASLQRQYGMFGWCWAKLIDAQAAKKERFDRGLKLAEDFDYYLKIYANIKTIYIDDKPLYHYRVDSENGSMISAADDEIDYFSQLILNLRYKKFLDKMGVLSGENQHIVDQLISNYSFFVLFHSDLQDFNRKFSDVYSIWKENGYPLLGFDFSSEYMLRCIRCNKCNYAKSYLKLYRWLRKIIRNHH